MFCAECGTKNETSAQFCENCGASLNNGDITPKPVVKKEKQPMTKKNKIIIGVVSVVVVLLLVGYFILSNLTNPKNVAEDFFNATTSYDAEKMYGYLDVSDSEFTTKDMFKKIIASEIEDEEKPVIVNYTVGKAIMSADKMSATVTVTYMLKDEDNSDTMDIKLVKDKKKKWLLFDNWKVNTKNVSTVKDYTVKVMKGSKVTIEGVELKSKYLDKEESTDTMDVYSMPAMFNAEYKVEVTLPLGMKIEDTMRVNSYSSYTCSLSLSDLSDDSKNKLKEASKNSLQALYNGAKDKKSFDEIKSTFEYKNADLSNLKSDYESLVNNLGSDYTLTSITFKDITLSSIDIDLNGHLELYVKATYDYSLSYQSGEETKTNDSNDYDYVYLTYDYVDGNYKLVEASSLNTYFSKYY